MSGEIGALRVRVLPDFAGFRGAAAAEGHAAGDAMGSGLVGAVREHWKGLVAGLAVAELGKKAFDFLGESVDAFKESAVGATQLRRIIGGTVEDTSRLRFALHEMGVSNEAVNTIFGRFSRQLEVQSGTTKGLSKLTDQLGFSVRDAAGNLRPMTEILPKIADRFKELPDGAEKTALAIQLFGRSGAGMIRFLNQGSEGIKELEKESDKFGNTISTKSVADLAKYGKAHRELTAATEGLKISIGEKLMPIITQFEVYLAEKGIPALQKFGSWIKDNIIPIILDFAKVIQHDVLPPLQTMFEFFQKHPAVLHAVETAVKTLAIAWGAWKLAGLVTKLWEMAAALGAVGAAGATAAAESTAGVEAGAAAGAGAARVGAARFSAAKLVVPIAVTYAVTSALGLNKAVGDLIHGDIANLVKDSPQWSRDISAALGKTLKLTRLPGTGGLFTGDITGELIGPEANVKGQVKAFWEALDDRTHIASFQNSLKTSKIWLDNTSKALDGNSDAAITNRARIGRLVDQAKIAAGSEERLTGKASDYTAALHLSIPAIENAATALGFNKEQVDKLLISLGLIPPTKNTKVTTETAEAQQQVDNFLVSLSRIPPSVRVPIITYVQGILPESLGGGATNPLAGPAQGYSPHARGGIAQGWVKVGEEGVELMHVGSPSAVLPHRETMAALGSGAPLLNIEHWHGDQTDADGLASMLNAKQRAYAASKGI